MDTTVLYNNFVNIVKEAELKIGYAYTSFSMYYPLASLNRMMDTDLNADEMKSVIENLSDDKIGKIDAKIDGDRFCITISKDGVKYIHENVENKFLEALIGVIKKYPCTEDDVKNVFLSASKSAVIKKVDDNDEFDFLMYFEDGIPDDNIYCLHFDFGMPEYHRFTRNEFKKFNFADLID